ncbi:MAG: M81 family peptidase [Chitinophagaceae bacterium]|nr:MAG: M81 family peptidase [Chitinophagaceae bacterium]
MKFFQKTLPLFVAGIIILSSCGGDATKELPRIAIAGIAIESCTFSPSVTEEEAFHPKYGTEVFTSYGFLSQDSALYKQALWFPAVVARSLPDGIVSRAAYESIVSKTVDSLKKNGPFDGIYLDIHGAMTVQGMDDAEADYVQRIRDAVGPNTLISASMDLHGNVSPRLAELLDLVTAYRMAPHEDALETKRRAVTNLLARLESGKGRPAFKAYIPIPILLPGEKTSTRLEPAKSVYAAVKPAAAQPGIVDASIWIGYAWADEPRNHAVVMVTGDDQEKVTSTAQKLAKSFWDARKGFSFVAPAGSLDECLAKALASDKHPFFISDCGDNPTAGATGDVTFALKQLLARPEFRNAGGPSLIYASIPGPELVKQALAVGVGGKVDEYVGARIDSRFAGPVKLTGIVESIYKGDKQAEVEVVVRVGSMHVIVSQKRKAYRTEPDFTNLGLKPRDATIVIVKLGYIDPDLYNMKADWMLALTPGAADQDILHLPYKRIQHPMFPFDSNMADPDLKPRMIPAANSKARSQTTPAAKQ